MPKLILGAALVAGLACHPVAPSTPAPAEWLRSNPAAPTYELRNGRWLSGGSFEVRTWYAV